MIPIFPYQYSTHEKIRALKKVDVPGDLLWKGKDHLFFFNGKTAIHYLANFLKLKREDEVAIFTTFDENYISTCVSATLFNYCKISRVVTEKTKMIYVIHEFGVPYKDILRLKKIARDKNVPLVEDCAHTILSTYKNGERVGSVGDYAIYSLAKHMPVKSGGLLVGNTLTTEKKYYNSLTAKDVEKKYFSNLPYVTELSKRRQIHFKNIMNEFKGHKVLFEYDPVIIPYFIVFKTKKYQELYEKYDGKVAEWGRTHVENWFCVSTQPFMSSKDLKTLISYLKKVL